VQAGVAGGVVGGDVTSCVGAGDGVCPAGSLVDEHATRANETASERPGERRAKRGCIMGTRRGKPRSERKTPMFLGAPSVREQQAHSGLRVD